MTDKSSHLDAMLARSEKQSAKQAQRTPGPWRATRTNGTARYWSIVDEHGGCVATTEYDKHAETIVRACNAHDDLVAALREMCDAYSLIPGPEMSERQRAAYIAARAALAKVDA